MSDKSFQASKALRSAHLQTLWGPLLRRTDPLPRVAEKLSLDDGDHLWLHWHGKPSDGNPLVCLLHGLAGCHDSHYILGIQTWLAQQGHASVVINARGAGRPNDRARFYHAGETADLAQAVAHINDRFPRSPLLMAGYSLGGSRLLNWLAEGGHPAVASAAATSVPFLLAACAERLNQGLSRLYRHHLLSELLGAIANKKAHLEKVAPDEHRRLVELGELKGIRTFREFDDRIIAPLHGFSGADDYYQRASTRPKLRTIAAPTLLIQAADDPFMSDAVLPCQGELGPAMQLALSRHGGHVGFVRGLPWRPDYWLEARITEFFSPWLSAGANNRSRVPAPPA